MRERRHLVAAVLLVAGLALRLMTLSACGGSPDNQYAQEIAFTPTPTIIVVRDCRNGTLDAHEVCDESAPNGDAACTAQGKSCLCCACLGDGETLGERTFSLARPGSAFQSSGLSCTDVSSDESATCMGNWLPGPLILVAGRPDPETCIAPLTLKEDVILGLCQPIGVACFKLSAAESEGSLDCDGGTPYDVEYEQDSNGRDPDSPPVIRRGLGDIALTGQSGAGDLLVTNRVAVNVQGVFDPAKCLTIDYDNPASDPLINPLDVSVGPLAFTTRSGAAIVIDSLVPNANRCDFEGANFSSCGHWTEENGDGILVAPLTALGQLGGVIDTANILVGADRAAAQ